MNINKKAIKKERYIMNFTHEQNRIFALDNDGELIAEITFPDVSDGIVEINHTFVDESLRGQGVASKLITEAYKEIKKQDKRAILSCSYAVKWFEKNKDCSDILV